MAAQNVRYVTESGEEVYGLMAQFSGPADFYHAAEMVRDAGFRKWDAYSPFPVHGIDEAMGLPRPRLPLLVAVVGLGGAALGFLFQYFVTAIAYPMVVQGKPYAAWEPFIPVTFEIGVLFTAFTCILGMMAFNGLPRLHHPLLTRERFLRVSDDAFIIAIEAADPRFDAPAVQALLTQAGALAVEVVTDPRPAPAPHAPH
ncbi:MAG: DUF3341 domain-containing protein [Planctomyces sp.]|nr:DUF3341 domain-containing protein [Planctomyces sp.]MBA4120076.1 DUF3341 domain-containing protein [Isosphaera sp.]